MKKKGFSERSVSPSSSSVWAHLFLGFFLGVFVAALLVVVVCVWMKLSEVEWLVCVVEEEVFNLLFLAQGGEALGARTGGAEGDEVGISSCHCCCRRTGRGVSWFFVLRAWLMKC